MGELEELQRERIAIILLADVAAATKRVDHSEQLARCPAEETRDLVQRESVRFAGQQFENIEALVQRRNGVTRRRLASAQGCRTLPRFHRQRRGRERNHTLPLSAVKTR